MFFAPLRFALIDTVCRLLPPLLSRLIRHADFFRSSLIYFRLIRLLLIFATSRCRDAFAITAYFADALMLPPPSSSSPFFAAIFAAMPRFR